MRESDLSPKSVVRDMYEQGRTFTEFVAHYGLARSEGLVLRYLSNAYRALRQTVPEQVKTDELDEIIEWLGETVRQTDSSLLDEWEALTDPESVARAAAAIAAGEAPPPPRPITAQRARVHRDGAQRDVPEGAARRRATASTSWRSSTPPRPRSPTRPGAPAMTAPAWEEALGAYWDEHESMGAGPQARSPELLMIDRQPAGASSRTWTVRQIIDDPEGHHDFAIVATVDLDASDAAGEPVIRTASFAAAGIAS